MDVFLERCPCCDGDRVGTVSQGLAGAGGRIRAWRASVVCEDCATTGPERTDDRGPLRAELAAVEAWNAAVREGRRLGEVAAAGLPHPASCERKPLVAAIGKAARA